MKKITLIVVSLLVMASLLLSACGNGEIIMSPNEPGAVPGVQVSSSNVWNDETLNSLHPIREFMVNGQAQITIQIMKDFDPALGASSLLGVYPKALVLSQADTPGFGPADLLAIVAIAGTTYFVFIYYADRMPAPVINFPVNRLPTILDEASRNVSSMEFVAIEQTTIQAEVAIFESLPTTTLTSEQWSAEMDQVLGGNYLESTKHQESMGVISAFTTLSDGKVLKSRGYKCEYKCNGSVQLWAGINSDGTASVAIVYIASTKVAFGVLKGQLLTAASGAIISDKMINLGGGQYIDPTKAIWAAAFVLTKGMGKAYDPMNALDVGEGLAAWQYKQAQYNLYIPLAQITLP